MAASTKGKPKRLDDTPAVDQYIQKLEHPFKAEMEAIRTIIMNANPQVTEGIKWNSPSFYYKGDMVVFATHVKDYVHLVFPNGIVINDQSGLLEGDYKDRRMAYFYDMKDVELKKKALENVIRGWVTYMDSIS